VIRAVINDQLDLVRSYYRALNSRDADAVTAMYDVACVTEGVFVGAFEEMQRGREEYRRQLDLFFDTFVGGFDDGSCFQVRSIAGHETGWGWVHAEWVHRIRERERGRTRQFRGYSHFLIEDGLIRRQRNIARETPPDEVISGERPSSNRRYPEQPVVGVGGVILVTPAEAARIGWFDPLGGTGVVLVKRQFEPLAGQWSLPGGALEVGETLETGVAREMLEETGLTVSVGPMVEAFDRILLDHDARVRYHFVLIDYVCYPRVGRLHASSDVVDVTIAEPDRLARYELTGKAQDVIEKALSLKA